MIYVCTILNMHACKENMTGYPDVHTYNTLWISYGYIVMSSNLEVDRIIFEILNYFQKFPKPYILHGKNI